MMMLPNCFATVSFIQISIDHLRVHMCSCTFLSVVVCKVHRLVGVSQYIGTLCLYGVEEIYKNKKWRWKSSYTSVVTLIGISFWCLGSLRWSISLVQCIISRRPSSALFPSIGEDVVKRQTRVEFLWFKFFRCQSPGVENFTISELKQWNEELDQQLTCRPLEEITKGEISGRCSQWIYDSDHGFKSLTSEVRA